MIEKEELLKRRRAYEGDEIEENVKFERVDRSCIMYMPGDIKPIRFKSELEPIYTRSPRHSFFHNIYFILPLFKYTLFYHYSNILYSTTIQIMLKEN